MPAALGTGPCSFPGSCGRRPGAPRGTEGPLQCPLPVFRSSAPDPARATPAWAHQPFSLSLAFPFIAMKQRSLGVMAKGATRLPTAARTAAPPRPARPSLRPRAPCSARGDAAPSPGPARPALAASRLRRCWPGCAVHTLHCRSYKSPGFLPASSWAPRVLSTGASRRRAPGGGGPDSRSWPPAGPRAPASPRPAAESLCAAHWLCPAHWTPPSTLLNWLPFLYLGSSFDSFVDLSCPCH